MSDEQKRRLRWRLVLGRGAEDILGGSAEQEWLEREQALSYLYDNEYGDDRNVRSGAGSGDSSSGDGSGAHGQTGKTGSLDPSNLTIPEWINLVHTLFPKRTIERIEKDALERYNLQEMVTNPDLLRRAQPNRTLLKAILHTKHLMNPEVLAIARQLVGKVVQEMLKQIAREVRQPFSGTRDPRTRSFIKVAKNFDAKATIHANLKNFDPQTKRLYIKTPYFNSRVRRKADKWQIIILVDQSGSMVNSVIHAAITASIFFGIKTLRTHLIAFDTSVVDLTEDCNDPVEMLMRVQLGGGTNIGKALTYAESLIDYPRRTIVVLISDFYEGANPKIMLGITRKLIDDGVKVLGLAALDREANPNYSRPMAETLAKMGAKIAAMTPMELADWVADAVK